MEISITNELMDVVDEDSYRPPPVSEAPWLIVTHENRRKFLEKQTFTTISPLLPKNKSYIKRIPELDSKTIIGSSFDWLILMDRYSSGMYSLWNPVTLQSIHLPELPDDDCDAEDNDDNANDDDEDDVPPQCVLTSAPGDENTSGRTCVLVLFFRGLVFFCRPTTGDDCRWFKQKLEHDGEDVQIDKAVTLNGDIYAYAHCNFTDGDQMYMFTRIKVTDGSPNSLLFEPALIELPDESVELVYPRIYRYLVEASSVVYYVRMIMRQLDEMGNYDICKVLVWKLDPSHMEWIQIDSLGDRAFLLGEYSSTWCFPGTSGSVVEGIPIEKDSIYYTSSGCQIVHSYRLRDESHSILQAYTCPIGDDNPTWFMPHYNIRYSPDEENKTQNVEEGHHAEAKDMEEELELKILRDILSQLPEILISIANRMHLFDYMNLRATCKTIRSMIPSPKWRDGCLFPLFMSLKNNKGLCELLDPSENISRTIKVPYYYSPHTLSQLDFCNEGWVLIQSKGSPLKYFNLFTMERGEYPAIPTAPIDLSVIECTYSFSTNPTSSDCLTIGIEGFGADGVAILCYEAAYKEWNRELFNCDIEFKPNRNSSPKYYNGAFYSIGREGHLGVFKIVGDEWSWKVYPGPLSEKERASINSCYLVEVDGQLIAIYFRHVGRKVQVFKFEMLEKTWIEFHELGEHVLFLSHASTFSALEKDIEKRNRIYLPKRMDGEIAYYSLETQKYHTLGKRDPMDGFYGMTTQSFCCWI